MAVIEITIWQPLIIGQTISTLPYYSTIVDKLELIDSVVTNQYIEHIDDRLVLHDRVTHHYPSHSISITDTLRLTQSLAPVIELRIEDTLSLIESIIIPTNQHVTQSLAIHQYIYQTVRQRLIVRSQLELIQTFSFELITLNPYVERLGNNLPTNDWRACAGETATIRFTNPTTSNVIVLPRPEFADSIDQQTTRINQKSRGLSPIIFAIPFWPKSTVHKLTFSTLTDVTRRAFVEFYMRNYGLLLEYTDLQGRVHVGVITTQEPELVEHNNCAWGVNLEFTEL